MKKVLLLGSNLGSVEIAEYVRKKGEYLIVTDYYPIEKSPAKQLADESWDISTLDVEALYRKCREEHVDAVLSSTGEQNLSSAVRLAKMLDLPFYTMEESWKYTNDKILFKEMCRKHGIPVAEDYTEENPPAAGDFPVIVKPADNCLNRGLTICKDISQFKDACVCAYENSPGKRIVIEKYIEGTMIQAGYYMADGKTELYAVMETVVRPQDPGSCYSVHTTYHNYTDLYLKKYDAKVREMLKDIGCRNGTAFVQTMMKNETLYFLEINYRIDGFGFFRTVKDACGIDLVKIITDISLYGKTDAKIIPYKEEENPRMYVYNIWSYKKCKIARIEGLDAIEKMENVKINSVFKEGEKVNGTPNAGTLMAAVTFYTQNEEETENLMNTINHTFYVYDEKGRDILSKFDSYDLLPTKEKK